MNTKFHLFFAFLGIYFLNFLFSCESNDFVETPKVSSEKAINTNQKYLKLQGLDIRGDYNLVHKYTYDNQDMISQVDITDYGTSSTNPNPLKITRIKLNYNHDAELDTMTLYDINVKSHDVTEIEQYIWHHQDLIYYNLFDGAPDYYGRYNFKFYEGQSDYKIKSSRYFQTKKFDNSVVRDYSYDTINSNSILTRMKELRDDKVYFEYSHFTSIKHFYNPFRSFPFYLIPILTDLNISYEPDQETDTPFYGINQIINQSDVYPANQVFILFFGEQYPPYIQDTIVKQIDGFVKVNDVEYPNFMKIVHTGLDYSSKHPNHTYVVNFDFDLPNEIKKK